MNFRNSVLGFFCFGLVSIVRAAAPSPEPTMSWQAWVTIGACIALLLALALNLAKCVSAMVCISAFLFLCGIIELKDVFNGLGNSSVVTICLLFIIVDPIAELPLVLKGMEKVLGDLGSVGGIRFANFKITVLCLLTSSFFNNTPQVAVLTNLIKNHCRKVNASPSQLLMPMNFATLCGNYAVIATSTNLIVDGLMTKAKMGPMSFFELIKINGPFTIVMLWYLVYAPRWILPEHKGGLFRTITEKGRSFLSNFRVKPNSPLIGLSVKNVKDHYSRWLQDVEVIQIHRKNSVIFPVSDENRFDISDIVLLRGDITSVPEFDDILGLEPVIVQTDNNHLTTSFSGPPARDSLNNEPTSGENQALTPTDPVATPMREVLSKSFSMGASLYHHVPVNTQETEFFEVVIGNRCPHIGTTVGSNHFQAHYHASILAVREVEGTSRPDLFNEEMSAHLLSVGDTLLIIGRGTFREDWAHTGDFILINELRSSDKTTKVEEHFARFPVWFPFGNLATVSSGSESTKKVQCRLVAVPFWYEYTSLIVFVVVVSMAIAGYDIAMLALLGVIYSVTFGLTTAEKALSAIDYEVYVMVAFSFSIGTAMEKSGFANVLGNTLKNANVSGLSLLYIIGGISALMTNVITNKACVQVLVPLIIASYRIQEKDPLPGVMLCCAMASMALSTPYGFATNLMVMGPGGYTAYDFIKFGLPLNLLAVALCPIITYGVYSQAR
jgi:di/tricarboxylate transporter